MIWHGHESCLSWSCHSHQILLPLSARAWSARLQEGRAYASRFGPRHISRRQDALWCAKFTFSMLRQKGQTCTGKGQKKVTKKKTVFSYFCSLLFVSWEQQLPITSHTVTGSEPFQTLSPTWLLALHRTTSLLSSRIYKDTCQDIPAKCAVNTRNSSTYALLTTSYSIVAAAMRLRLVWLHQIKVWSTEVNGSQRRKLPSKNSSAVAPTSQTTTLTPNHGVKAKSPKKWRDFTWFYYSIPSHLTCAKETLYGALPAKLL